MKTSELLKLVIYNLDENSAQELVTIDVTGMTDIADTMVICTGTSGRHVQTLGEKIIESMKENNVQPLGIETDPGHQWTLVDLGDIIVHIMQSETRELYSLEKLWTKVNDTREKGSD